MLNMQNERFVLQMVQEREAMLRRTNDMVIARISHRRVRHWVGRQLVRFGTWLGSEPAMRLARAR